MEKMYDGAKATGASGMLLIDWFPGDESKRQYIPITGKDFPSLAQARFESEVASRNKGLKIEDQFDVNKFSKLGPTQNKLSLPTITYKKMAF